MNFKIGDRVICINDSIKRNYTNLKRDREYVIYSITICKCGKQLLDVGIVYTIHAKEYITTCINCNHDHYSNNNTSLCCESRFKKVEENKQVQYVKLEVEVEEPCYN